MVHHFGLVYTYLSTLTTLLLFFYIGVTYVTIAYLYNYYIVCIYFVFTISLWVVSIITYNSITPLPISINHSPLSYTVLFGISLQECLNVVSIRLPSNLTNNSTHQIKYSKMIIWDQKVTHKTKWLQNGTQSSGSTCYVVTQFLMVFIKDEYIPEFSGRKPPTVSGNLPDSTTTYLSIAHCHSSQHELYN